MVEIAKFLQSELQKVLGTTVPLEPTENETELAYKVDDNNYSNFVYPQRILASLGALFSHLAFVTGLAA